MSCEKIQITYDSSINFLPYDWMSIKDRLRKAGIKTISEYLSLKEVGLRERRCRLGVIGMKQIENYLREEKVDFPKDFYVTDIKVYSPEMSIYYLHGDGNYWTKIKRVLYDNGIKTLGDYLSKDGERVLRSKWFRIDGTVAKINKFFDTKLLVA